MSTIIFFLPFILIYTIFAVYGERKISAFIQDRYGPMEVGKYGWYQTVADLLKLIQKEDIVPKKASKKLFLIAPVIIFTSIFCGFVVLPITSSWEGTLTQNGVYFLLAIVSLDVVGILMAGWGANSKYSLLGALRSVAQIISYEIPVTLSVLCVIMISQSLNLQEISYQQGILINAFPDMENVKNYLFGISALNIDVTNWGGVFTWNIFRAPVLIPVFIIYFISTLAESNRAPFDLPEAESELVAGFHTEYSGFRWAIIMLSEYGMMLLVALLGVILFLGSWNTPLPNIGNIMLANWTTGEPETIAGNLWSVFWLLSKALMWIAVQMWVRWTYPRLRIDQLMSLSWKYLTPFAMFLIFVSGLWRLLMI
ncbi:MAG: NADH-quinone oxidoreductase subunit H [Cyclobacteriaceae bacterium]|nr:NADH-quinone oxidoreductase subunit H [Cyclobacteriaceae bacterium]